MKNKRLILIIAGVLVTLSAYAASKQFNVSEMILGTGSGITRFIFRNGTDHEIRSNPATGKIEVTQDGLNFKTLGSGSGSGSGVNALQESNPNFEDGTGLWTASVPASFTSETTEQLFGVASGKFDPAASGETLDSAEIVLEKGFYGQRCQLAFKYKYTGSTGDYTVEVQDEADAAILKQDLLATVGDDIGNFAQSFPCGSGAGSALQVRIESTTDAGALYIDSVFLGTGRSEIAIQQNQLYAAAYYPPTASCLWSKGVSGPFAIYDADTDCVSIIKTAGTGEVDTTDNNLPDIVLPNAPAGTYEVSIQFSTNHTAVGFGDEHRILSGQLGVGTAGDGLSYPSATNSDAVNNRFVSSVFVNPTQQTLDFGLAISSTAATNYIQSGSYPVSFIVKFYPDNPTTAQTYDTEQGRFWEGVIKHGGSSINLATTATTQSNITSTIAAIANKTGDAKILCTDGSLASSTCSSSAEQIGIAFRPTTSGLHKVCFQFQSLQASVNLGGSLNRFQLAELDDSNAVVQFTEAVRLVADYGNQETNKQQADAVNICANVNATAGVDKRIGLFYSVASFSSGQTTANLITNENLTPLGERVLHFTVESKTHASSLPVFPDFQKKVESVTPDIITASCKVDYAGGVPLAGSADCDNWIQSYADNAAGDVTLNFPGVFTTLYGCVANHAGLSGAGFSVNATVSSNSSVNLQLRSDGGVAADSPMFVICRGQK